MPFRHFLGEAEWGLHNFFLIFLCYRLAQLLSATFHSIPPLCAFSKTRYEIFCQWNTTQINTKPKGGFMQMNDRPRGLCRQRIS